MPKTSRPKHTHLCERFSANRMNEFRAVVMALGNWRIIPANMFFHPDGTPRNFEEICTLLPSKIYKLEEWEVNDPVFWKSKKASIDAKYKTWKQRTLNIERNHGPDFEKMVHELEDKVSDLPFKDRISAARAEIFKTSPFLDALAMVDPLGRSLNIRGLITQLY